MEVDPDPTKNTLAKTTTTRLRRQWGRTALALGVAVLLLATTATMLLLNPRIMGSLIARRLGDTVGGTAEIQSFAWTGWGKAKITGLRFLVPDWVGPGEEILNIDQVRFEIDVVSLVWGVTTIRNVEADQVKINIVNDTATHDTYNFERLLRIDRQAATQSPVIIERAKIANAVISLQQVGGNVATELMSWTATGELRPSSTDATQSILSIQQTDGEIHVDGSWNQSTLAFHISADGLKVSERLAVVLPRALRRSVRNADASGTIRAATLSWAPNHPLRGMVDVAAVQATLPIDISGNLVRYEAGKTSAAEGQTRIKLHSGKIELDGTTMKFLDLDFDLGNSSTDDRLAIVPVTASLELDFGQLMHKDFDWDQRTEWAKKVQDFAGFQLQINVKNIEIGRDGAKSAIEIPQQIANIFKVYTLQTVKASAKMTASRLPPITTENGELVAQPIEIQGALIIEEGTGAFDDFPYQIHSVTSNITFTNSDAHIASLQGFGSEGAHVLIVGDVVDMGATAGVDLKITAASLPIDTALMNSFTGADGELLSSLFWHDGFKSLQEAGILFDKAQIKQMEIDVSAATELLTRLTSDPATQPAEIDRLATAAGRLRRHIDQGAFTPGGHAKLDLRVFRPKGTSGSATVTGLITLLDADILCSQFPYPIRAHDGKIQLRKNGIELGDGIRFTSLNGIEGTMKGSVDLRKHNGRLDARPSLEFSLRNEQLGPLFYSAIPPGPHEDIDGWPGQTLSAGGTILSQLNPRGQISIDGKIMTLPDDTLDFSCDIQFKDGTIQPTIPTENILTSTGLFWPAGFGLDDCVGVFHISHDQLHIESFKGFRRDGQINASGTISLDGTSTNVAVGLKQIELADYALNLVPFEEKSKATELWQRYQPIGRFDADIVVNTPLGGGASSTFVTVAPKMFALTLPGGQVRADFSSGTVTIKDKHFHCDALSGTLGALGGSPATICVEGRYGADSGTLDLQGTIENGLIHGPIIGEIVERIGAHGMASFLNEFQPEGRYDATVGYSKSPTHADASFSLDAFVHQLSLGSSQARLDLVFQSPAEVHARGGKLQVAPFEARFPGGSIQANGWLSSNDQGLIDNGEFAVNLSAIGTGNLVIGALPRVAQDPLTAMGFECRDILNSQTRLRISRPSELIQLDVDSDVQMYGANFSTTPRISNINAHMQLHIQTDANMTSFDSQVTDARMLIGQRQIEGASLQLSKTADSSKLRIKSFHGSIGAGTITADAHFDTVEPFQYAVDIGVADAPLTLLAGSMVPIMGTASESIEDPGLVEGRLEFQGNRGENDHRLGRGSISIRKAELAELPIGIALLQLSQLHLTLNPILQHAYADFTINQDQLQFQRFELQCPGLSLLGEGSLNIPNQELALRLRTSGEVPLLSDLVSGVTNTLFKIDVRGTISDPQAKIAPIPFLTDPPKLPPMPMPMPMPTLTPTPTPDPALTPQPIASKAP